MTLLERVERNYKRILGDLRKHRAGVARHDAEISKHAAKFKDFVPSVHDVDDIFHNFVTIRGDEIYAKKPHSPEFKNAVIICIKIMNLENARDALLITIPCALNAVARTAVVMSSVR